MKSFNNVVKTSKECLEKNKVINIFSLVFIGGMKRRQVLTTAYFREEGNWRENLRFE